MNMEELLPAAPEKIEEVTAKPAKKKPAPGKFLEEHWAGVAEKKAALEVPEKPEPVNVRLTDEVAHTSETAEILKTPLYEMVDDYNALVDYLVERGGVMDEESVSAWDSIQGTVKEKLENCGKVLRELKAKESNLKDESKRMGDRAKVIKNSHTRLKDYAKDQMIRMDMPKCEGVVLNLTVANTKATCTVTDEHQVPDDFCNVTVKLSAREWTMVEAAVKAVTQRDDIKTERTVDKAAVVEEWKANAGAVQVAGTVVEKGTSLRIY